MSFSYCLNTSTIRSDGATIINHIDTAADAGWDGIEPWVNELDEWVAGGGTLAQVRDHAGERGLQIVDLIGFPEWAVPEDDRRLKGLEEAARCFQMAQDLGCPCVAAPPFGIHDRQVDLLRVPERFADLVDLAAEFGVTPLLEYWGIAQTLGKTGEVLLVAAECGRPGVQMLADVFHMYKGTGHHYGFEHFGNRRLGLVHMNDYPADPVRADITDADRVYPGDGLAPWPQIVASLKAIGFDGMLSLELFNESYWAQGPEVVARKGLEKLKRCVEG
ncbi:MAG: sugar phosphate isomerase/epimerase [Gemmatimonadetes bacterium]|jgi:2-keto-myo-inositol isomerase|nr:sugar phosphate isomerase/epimerase [Gemmatimonadota bacterium]MBT6150066.1 sugar phosphate isomerase/epimerase [Gemmatimonadota bacterium]MBT7861060.1 sugar phosphate isomerase/epimerase [Gemmatimonadota bacterium]